MTIKILAIVFNHDTGSAASDALNIRRNGAETVPVPEWRQGFSNDAEDSVAAYAINPTRGNQITIQARFVTDQPERTVSIEVRAIDPQPTTAALWYQALLEPLALHPALYVTYFQIYAALRDRFTLRTPNVLGQVKPRTVVLQNGDSGFQTFELDGVRLASFGIGIHDIMWRWQYRRDSRSLWTDLSLTKHRIYSVLDLPTAPWVQFPFDRRNTQLPWVEVLDYACAWADGASTLDDAATRITKSVHDLGPELLEYDCVGLSGPHYTASDLVAWPPVFYCTNFLQRLRGIYPDRYVNCVDCATIVSTFANALGCDLWQSRMGYMFELNPTRAIGTSQWTSACGADFFFMHEVAWEGNCTENHQIFDACLEVDTQPQRPLPQPLLPTNMLFGGAGDGGYRDYLASIVGRLKCEPRPETRQRKIVI